MTPERCPNCGHDILIEVAVRRETTRGRFALDDTITLLGQPLARSVETVDVSLRCERCETELRAAATAAAGESWYDAFCDRVNEALAGSYNQSGIIAWWERPRPQLDGATPAEVLADATGPNDPRLARVLALAEELRGPGDAT